MNTKIEKTPEKLVIHARNLKIIDINKYQECLAKYFTKIDVESMSLAHSRTCRGGRGGNCPPSFKDLGKIKIFRAVRKKYLGKIIIFRAAIQKIWAKSGNLGR